MTSANQVGSCTVPVADVLWSAAVMVMLSGPSASSLRLRERHPGEALDQRALSRALASNKDQPWDHYSSISTCSSSSICLGAFSGPRSQTMILTLMLVGSDRWRREQRSDSVALFVQNSKSVDDCTVIGVQLPVTTKVGWC